MRLGWHSTACMQRGARRLTISAIALGAPWTNVACKYACMHACVHALRAGGMNRLCDTNDVSELKTQRNGSHLNG